MLNSAGNFSELHTHLHVQTCVGTYFPNTNYEVTPYLFFMIPRETNKITTNSLKYLSMFYKAIVSYQYHCKKLSEHPSGVVYP